MWKKNIVNLDAKETEAQRILKKYELRVTDIVIFPLFKADWAGLCVEAHEAERFQSKFHIQPAG